LLIKGEAGEIYNVASGQGTSLEDLLFKMADLVGIRAIPEADPELMRPADIPHLVGDPAKLRGATGWSPRRSLEETLRDVLDAQTD
jgi:GDP-4-dehydro-6-deoxy-D-mannose reductase